MSANSPIDEETAEDEDNGATDDVALTPNEAADDPKIVDAKIPEDIRKTYEIISYRNAAVILSEAQSEEFKEICEALRAFRITTRMIRMAGRNESEMPK